METSKLCSHHHISLFLMGLRLPISVLSIKPSKMFLLRLEYGKAAEYLVTTEKVRVLSLALTEKTIFLLLWERGGD